MFRATFDSLRDHLGAEKKQQQAVDAYHRETLQVEPLEERIMLAFLGFFDGVTLELVQTLDDGDVVVDNLGPAGAFRTTDNAGTLEFVPAQNVIVTLLDDTSNLLEFNVGGHSGNVQLNLGNGDREVSYGGGSIGGNLDIIADVGDQLINLAPVAHNTAGTVDIDLGLGFDTVLNNDNFVTVGQDLNLTGVNTFEYTNANDIDANLLVFGDVNMDTSNETEDSLFREFGTVDSTIFGNFNYTGGDERDTVQLNNTFLLGDVNIDLGDSIATTGNAQIVLTTGEISGNLNLATGDSILGNRLLLGGMFFGNTVIMNLGDTVDDISYSMMGAQADVMAVLGGGDDVFTLNFGVNVLDVDFGNDLGDEFNNNFGQFNFDSDLTNFQWFDHLYTEGDDTLVMNQLIDTGDIVIDNNGGTNFDWQLFTDIGGTSSTTRSRNLVLNMLSNTGNHVEIDLLNPVVSSITMGLGDGDRNVEFTGASNNPLRDIRITADAGDQNVALSVNAPLGVATLDVNLGSGFDTVDDNANNLIVSENFFLTGVNRFENDGLLSVVSKARIDVSSESVDTVFANNGEMFVGIDFQYIGGGGTDEVRLNGPGGTVITEGVSIDLGGNNGAGSQYALLDSALTSVGGPLMVHSTGSSGTDQFDSDPGTVLGGNVHIDLGDGDNDANILGVLGGSNVTYDGGSGADSVSFGTTGADADVHVNLGGGNDNFVLLGGSDISNAGGEGLFIDFGEGDDTFDNQFGPFDFSATLIQLDGFNHVYSLPTDTLTSSQVADPGPLTIDNNGTGGSIRFLDGGINDLTPVTNLSLHMLHNSGTSVNLRLDSSLAGDLWIDLGDGSRNLNFDGLDNSIGGELNIFGGADDQTVEIAINNMLSVSGDATINLGAGSDVVDEDSNDIAITGNLDFVGVNQFENNGSMTVGGHVSVDNSAENEDSVFDDDGLMSISGDLTYIGSGGRDEVTLNGTFGTLIAGDVTVDVGGNTNGGTQFIWFNSGLASIGGKLSVTSTDSQFDDSFRGNANASFGNDITIDLAGGSNQADIIGVFGGSDVKYVGRDGNDIVTFGTTGNAADVNIILGSNADTMTLLAGAAISPTSLRVDFGGGNDTFNNQFGSFTFNANLLNWHGFNRFYNHALSRIIMTQVADIGDVTVDNNGAANAIRMVNGFVTEMTPADDIRLNLMSNTSTDVTIDYDSAQAGYTILDLRNGSRDVHFSGDNNSIGDFLRIEAGINGLQNVVLAQNADLNVSESVVINLRDDHDTVDDGANGINVGTNFILRAVNDFENSNSMNVGGNLTVNNSFFEEPSMLANGGTLNVGNSLNYFGSTRNDNVLMNGADIAGNVNIELGGGDGTQTVDFSGASLARLRVVGNNSSMGNNILTDAGTQVAGDVIINLQATSTPNNITLQGTYGGLYGTYRGGFGTDTMIFGATANNMNFVTRLGDGSDTFTLQSTTNLLSSLLDFGPGVDTFNDEIGEPYPFPLKILNLN